MSRKPRKGYYVDGVFVAAGSELKATDAPSRTEVKNASHELQELGEDLLTLHADLLVGLPLDEKLRDAIREAKRLTNFEAQRRQRQFIGKLMRQLEPESLAAIAAALRIKRGQSARDSLILHRAEQWRDSLIADDDRLAQWIAEFPDTDVQHLRALIRQARKDAKAVQSGAVQRQGRAYRQIFTLVRTKL
jgi:ribosome-associated protein